MNLREPTSIVPAKSDSKRLPSLRSRSSLFRNKESKDLRSDVYRCIGTPPSMPTLNSGEPSHVFEREDERLLKKDQSKAENPEVWIHTLRNAVRVVSEIEDV